METTSPKPCGRCHKAIPERGRTCDPCRAYYRDWVASRPPDWQARKQAAAKPRKVRYYQEAKADGRCTRCQKRTAQDGFLQCAECRAHWAALRNTPEHRRKNRDYQTAWAKAHPDRVALNTRTYQHRLKAKVTEMLGGQCACCGETEPAFLSVDHVNKDGKRHRDMFPKNLDSYWRDLRKGEHGFEVQVLCFNCHMAKDYRGGCPHQLQG
jgi:hypothetical protein